MAANRAAERIRLWNTRFEQRTSLSLPQIRQGTIATSPKKREIKGKIPVSGVLCERANERRAGECVCTIAPISLRSAYLVVNQIERKSKVRIVMHLPFARWLVGSYFLPSRKDLAHLFGQNVTLIHSLRFESHHSGVYSGSHPNRAIFILHGHISSRGGSEFSVVKSRHRTGDLGIAGQQIPGRAKHRKSRTQFYWMNYLGGTS